MNCSAGHGVIQARWLRGIRLDTAIWHQALVEYASPTLRPEAKIFDPGLLTLHTCLVTLGCLGHNLPLPLSALWIVLDTPRVPLSFPEGCSDTSGTLLNSIWMVWHASKVSGSAWKATLAYFGTLPHPPRSVPGGTIHQNPRFFVSHCAYLA